MGFKKPRPKELRELAVTVPGDGDENARVHKGVELDDVLRQILWDMAEREGWSGNETARRIAISQPTLQDFFDETKDRGFTLASLSKVCAALKTSPADLFRQHERYRPENRDEAQFVEDLVFDRFRALLSTASARRLVRLLEVWNDRDSLVSQLDAWEKSAGLRRQSRNTKSKAAKNKAI